MNTAAHYRDAYRAYEGIVRAHHNTEPFDFYRPLAPREPTLEELVGGRIIEHGSVAAARAAVWEELAIRRRYGGDNTLLEQIGLELNAIGEL